MRSAFICTVAGLAVLIAAYTGNAWASIAPCGLFAFVMFPRWRTKLYRLIDKLVERVSDDKSPPQ